MGAPLWALTWTLVAPLQSTGGQQGAQSFQSTSWASGLLSSLLFKQRPVPFGDLCTLLVRLKPASLPAGSPGARVSPTLPPGAAGQGARLGAPRPVCVRPRWAPATPTPVTPHLTALWGQARGLPKLWQPAHATTSS